MNGARASIKRTMDRQPDHPQIANFQLSTPTVNTAALDIAVGGPSL
jgi:hypothetical protein